MLYDGAGCLIVQTYGNAGNEPIDTEGPLILNYQPIQSAFAPAVPQSYMELGIQQTIVLDLMLRRMLMEGFSNLQRLSNCLKLSMPVIDTCFRHMRQQQLVEVKGMIGNDYQFTLSQAGKQMASERFQVNQYAGPAPVSLKDYHAATQAQAARVDIDHQILKSNFSDLVVSDQLLDQLGPALISQSSIFIYGPSGNGKTSIAERMLRVYRDGILIPYAIEVDGQIISLYDPVVHTPIEVEEDPDIDPRWILCRRPCIVVGGELIPSMLELRLDDSSGLYAAPMQLKANNGIFIIDDFGRQLMSPRDLLNRWIVPLDRKIDYLTLRYGVKFQVPFELMVVFSTNLEPSDLADEAFLRRIHNKIYVEAVDANSFDQIFQRVMQGRRLQTDHDSSEYLRQLCLREGRTELRACYPSDIANIIMSIGKYEGQPPVITKSNLERAANLYFAKG